MKYVHVCNLSTVIIIPVSLQYNYGLVSYNVLGNEVLRDWYCDVANFLGKEKNNYISCYLHLMSLLKLCDLRDDNVNSSNLSKCYNPSISRHWENILHGVPSCQT